MPIAGESDASCLCSTLRMSASWVAEKRREAPGMSHQVAARGVPRSTWHSTTCEASRPRPWAMEGATSAMEASAAPPLISGSCSWNSTGKAHGQLGKDPCACAVSHGAWHWWLHAGAPVSSRTRHSHKKI